jgi:hypothetical protein
LSEAKLRSAGPVSTGDRFASLHAELMTLLRKLGEPEWERQATSKWRVREVVAHLLDGDIRRLSAHRDAHRSPAASAPRSYDELVAMLDDLNAEWIRVAGRMSVRVMLELLDLTGRAVAVFLEGMPIEAPALFPVAWAGVHEDTGWLDVGREYTERWHHQEQIRRAVGAAPLDAGVWIAPVLAVSMFALPRAWRPVEAEDGTDVVFRFEGAGGGSWTLRRQLGVWTLLEGAAASPAALISGEARNAAHLLLHVLGDEDVADLFQLEGPEPLTAPWHRTRAVMV